MGRASRLAAALTAPKHLKPRPETPNRQPGSKSREDSERLRRRSICMWRSAPAPRSAGPAAAETKRPSREESANLAPGLKRRLVEKRMRAQERKPFVAPPCRTHLLLDRLIGAFLHQSEGEHVACCRSMTPGASSSALASRRASTHSPASSASVSLGDQRKERARERHRADC
jgi:hypothetical protein